MKQLRIRPKKRNQASAPKDLSDIGVDRIHYNPADDFFVVSQDNLGRSNFQPAAKRGRRKPAAKTRARGAGRLGGFFLLIVGACIALPALTMTSSPSSDTSAVVVPAPGIADGAAQDAETARQEAAAALAQREQLHAREAASAAEQARLDAVAARSETVVYESCTDVWNTLGRAVLSTEPGYSEELDRDGDGTGCESRPAR